MVVGHCGDLIRADAGWWPVAEETPGLIDEAVHLGDVGEDAPIGGRAVVGLERADELRLEAETLHCSAWQRHSWIYNLLSEYEI